MLPILRAATDSPSGLTGFVLDLIAWLGELGVGVLAFVETIFPPIPSEVILSLAGYLSFIGELNLALVIAAATIGGYAGAVVLYLIGAWFGEERAIRWLGRLPLVDREDFEKAAAWFHRHGRGAVFFGRFVPIVRSLISLPAGAARMRFAQFTVYTVAGSLIWNALLVGAGFLLGTQHELVEEYSQYLDYVVYAAIVGILGWLIVRRLVRWRRARVTAPSAER